MASSSVVYVDVVPVLPAVAIISPTANSTFSANTSLTIQATATYSLGAIAKVDFFDGAAKLGESTLPVTGSTYSFTVVSGLSAGGHTLTAKATAVDASTATSAPVLISTNAVPPTVALTAPSNGATLVANRPFTLTATAADADGSVTKVEFFLGTTKLGEVLAAPYSFTVTAGLRRRHSSARVCSSWFWAALAAR
jgi:hypothetical protein